MHNTVKRARILYALIALFFAGLGILMYSFAVHGDEWASNRVNNHVYKYRQLANAGTIYDTNGEVLAETRDGERVYNESRLVREAVLHAVGDTEGFIADGVQNAYRSELLGYNFVDGVYDSVMKGKGNDIKLTLDANVCAAALDWLDGQRGTVGAYNYKTGEIVCMVSSPTFDPENKPDDMSDDWYEGVYINRFTTGVFTPGSIFKIVTGICALENIPDISKRKFECEGYAEIGSGEVICNSVHGTVSFEQALNASCNSAFSLIADELGKEKLTATVRELGLGKNVSFGRITTYRSTFDISKSAKIDIGWAGIGQYTTLVNPCQMMLLMGAIANGGTAINPYLVKESTVLGSILEKEKGKVCTNITLSEETAQKMKKLLRSNVVNQYSERFRSALEMCGKTGTAEVEGKRPHSWFVGFSQREDLPYAIVVMVENGGSGSSVAIPIANKVMKVIAGYSD